MSILTIFSMGLRILLPLLIVVLILALLVWLLRNRFSRLRRLSMKRNTLIVAGLVALLAVVVSSHTQWSLFVFEEAVFEHEQAGFFAEAGVEVIYCENNNPACIRRAPYASSTKIEFLETFGINLSLVTVNSLPIVSEEHNYYVASVRGDPQVLQYWNNRMPQDWRRYLLRQDQLGLTAVATLAGKGEPNNWRWMRDLLVVESEATPMTWQQEMLNPYYVGQVARNTQLSLVTQGLVDNHVLPEMSRYVRPSTLIGTRLYLVGVRLDREVAEVWRESLARLNAATSEEYGYLTHLVLVGEDEVSEGGPEVLLSAIVEYWSNVASQGRQVLGPNEMVVMAVTDGSVVSWMGARLPIQPERSQRLLDAIACVECNLELTHEVVVGEVRASWGEITVDDEFATGREVSVNWGEPEGWLKAAAMSAGFEYVFPDFSEYQDSSAGLAPSWEKWLQMMIQVVATGLGAGLASVVAVVIGPKLIERAKKALVSEKAGEGSG